MGLPRIDGPLLRTAINLFRSNESCAGDKVVAEMLGALDEDILETLAEAFARRVLNTEDNLTWKAPRDSHHVIRYPYDPGPDRLDDFKRHRDGGPDRKGAPEPTRGIGVPDLRTTGCLGRKPP